MTEGVKDQATAAPEQKMSDKEFNFRRVEAREAEERERRIKAEAENAYLRQQVEEIKTLMKPKEVDPIESLTEDDFQNPDKVKQALKASREKDRQAVIQEAAREATRLMNEKEEKDYLKKLRQEFPDLDQVLTESAIADLEKTDPDFLETVLDIPDEYKRRKSAYKYLKKKAETPRKEEAKASIQEKVADNQRNPYFIQSSQGASPSALDFDVRSPKARQDAYAKLKAAQRKPVGR